MTFRIRVYIAVGAILFLTVLSYSLWSHVQINRLESRVEEANQIANEKQRHAAELEQRSRVYEEKVVYLELQLSELRSLAAKQDEELRALESSTDNARRDVERARKLRSAAATATEVCRKLADLGHPCQE